MIHRSLRNIDMSDRELLAVMFDLNGNGDVAAKAIALRVFPVAEDEEDFPHCVRCVTTRLSWMRRYGLVDKTEEAGFWGIAWEGKAMLSARISQTMTQTLSAAPDAHGLSLAHLVGEKLVTAGTTTGHAMRRELIFQIERRKRVKG